MRWVQVSPILQQKLRPPAQLSGIESAGRWVLHVKSILAGLHHEYSLATALG
jgi:hypothetical protein